MTRSGPSATAAVVSVVARSRPAATSSAIASSRPASPGNGASPALTASTARGVDVAADDVVAGARDVRRQRQAHLAQRDDDDPHTRTVCRLRALSSTFSAQRTVCRPSSSVTAGDVVVAAHEVAERLELDEQRLAALQRVARRVALGDAAQRLRGVPLGGDAPVLVEDEV